MSITVESSVLRSFVERIFVAAGSKREEADQIAQHLVEANLVGHDSHGVGVLPSYMEQLKAGFVHPNQMPLRIGGNEPFAVFDGQMGYGQPIANTVMDEAAEIAARNGIAIVALRNVQHIGRIGAYGERLAKRGLVSLHFVNAVRSEPCVAPFNGSDARIMTNPICIAIPGTTPLLLDFATSGIAMGKARVAYNKGVSVAPGKLIDSQGQPTNDPAVIWTDPRGALLAFGEHKGWGLALMAEVLGGLLTGGPSSSSAVGRPCGLVNGLFSIVLEPNRLVDIELFDESLAHLVNYVKASPPASPDNPVQVPGETERDSHIARARAGVPLDEETWRQICGWGEKLGVKSPTDISDQRTF